MHPKAALIKMTSGIDYKIMVSLHYEFLSRSSGVVIEKIILGIVYKSMFFSSMCSYIGIKHIKMSLYILCKKMVSFMYELSGASEGCFDYKITLGIDYKIIVSLHYEFLSGSSGVIILRLIFRCCGRENQFMHCIQEYVFSPVWYL